MTRGRGFTLLELLVVLFIIGLGAAAATLALGPGRSGQLAAAGRGFAGALAAVRDEALLARQHWGAELYRDADGRGAYRWWRLEPAGWRRAAPPGREPGGVFPIGAAPALTVEGRPRPLAPAAPRTAVPILRMSPGGEMTSFLLVLGADDERVRVRGDALGRITLETGDGD